MPQVTEWSASARYSCVKRLQAIRVSEPPSRVDGFPSHFNADAIHHPPNPTQTSTHRASTTTDPLRDCILRQAFTVIHGHDLPLLQAEAMAEWRKSFNNISDVHRSYLVILDWLVDHPKAKGRGCVGGTVGPLGRILLTFMDEASKRLSGIKMFLIDCEAGFTAVADHRESRQDIAFRTRGCGRARQLETNQLNRVQDSALAVLVVPTINRVSAVQPMSVKVFEQLCSRITALDGGVQSFHRGADKGR